MDTSSNVPNEGEKQPEAESSASAFLKAGALGIFECSRGSDESFAFRMMHLAYSFAPSAPVPLQHFVTS